MKRKTWTALAAFSLSTLAWSFEWPLSNMNPDKILSYFGQKRGSTVSSSLIMENSPEKGQEEEWTPKVHASENGKVLMILSDISDDNDFFPSTLGQAVILEHSDNVLSVYGNLSPDSSFDDFEPAPFVSTEQVLGISGNSSWKEKNYSSPAVQILIIDTKKEIAINPSILLPRMEKEKSFPPSEVILENKDGKRFELNTTKNFAAGNYKFYQKRNESIVPLKISLSVNGELLDEIDLSNIIQNDNLLLVQGLNKKFETSTLYPDERYLLVGETRLSKGKSVITIENTNLLDEKRLGNYSITVW